MIAQLARLRGALPLIETPRGGAELVDAARTLARQMGEAGALWLAFSTLGHVRLAAGASRPRDVGLAMADQAWVARTLGDLDSAEELYDEVTAAGLRAGETELVARALLGKGVTARVRGNYPKARKWLREGLEQAESAGLTDLIAIGHQGLLIAAGTAGDLDTALVHGWAAYELLADDQDRQAEVLINIAQASLDAGQAIAARSGFLASMSRSESPRFRLACLGGAAVASATVGDSATLERLACSAEDSLSPSAFPYETAGVLKSLYQAFDLVGDASRAEDYRLRARALARKNGFFEVVLATEVREPVKPARSTEPVLSDASWSVIHSLESMESESSALALSLTQPD